jgi:hypothetical protein
MLGQGTSTPLVDLGNLAAQILIVIVFLIPGLNCTWLIDRLVGRTSISATERLLRAISLSLIVYAVASPWLLRIARGLSTGTLWVWEPILAAITLILIAPPSLALLIVRLRRSDRFRKVVRRLSPIHPAPTAWDFAFSTGGPFFVRVRLSSGERLGGFFGERSFATGYPEPPDLFLEEAWHLTEDGAPVQPIPGSRGVLVKHDVVELLEFLEVSIDGEDRSD